MIDKMADDKSSMLKAGDSVASYNVRALYQIQNCELELVAFLVG